MTCSPSQLAPRLPEWDGRDCIRSRAAGLLDHRGCHFDSAVGTDAASIDAALATQLMDLYRRTADPEVFDCLVQWVTPQLTARIRSRLRGLGGMFDVHEILQDTIVNIYRYPDRFVAARAGAFAAWSSMIVDNAIRRQLRNQRRPDMSFSSPEMLQEQADVGTREPCLMAQDQEECAATASAFAVLLHCYLRAFSTLSERERFVLQMVEVRQLRYAELAVLLGIRPEALKMVVFRARKRLLDRTAQLVAGPARTVDKSTPRTLAIA